MNATGRFEGRPIVRDTWERRVGRAEQLLKDAGPAASLLAFYARLLRTQRDLASVFARWPPRPFEHDLAGVGAAAAPLLREVADHGPDQLRDEARALLGRGNGAVDDELISYWRAPSDRQFFAKAILQPYAEHRVKTGAPPDRASAEHNRCPCCGGNPQLSILDPAATEGDGGARHLLCATCLTPWPFARVVCPHCGETDERKLGYFQSPAFEHLRLDVCDACGRYLKTVDVGKLGLAVPLVDEVAGAPLDLWASERGYVKIELNLLGL